LVGTTYAGGINVLATGVALIIMDKVGRKTLILWSTGGMFLSCIIVVLSLLGYFNNVVALCSVLVYVVFFEIGYVRDIVARTRSPS
jgi:MFS transporter, SP family, solute carrier family 2 (facilitated glucose transporter), member 3